MHTDGPVLDAIDALSAGARIGGAGRASNGDGEA
jgi:hypothetical protein